MNNRSRLAILLASGLAAAALTQPAISTAQPSPGPRVVSRPGGLDRLRAEAGTAVRVHRDAAGRVDLLRAPGGHAMVAAPDGTAGRPEAAARAFLSRYGAAVHAGTVTGLVSLPSATGGSVVRATQLVDGLPVVGGDVVLSLDAHQGLLSIAASTTATTTVPSPTVPADHARRTAVAVVAKAHRVAPGTLAADGAGEWLYDPSVVGEPALGARPVWRFEVSGPGVRELVLVDAGRGGVALHVSELDGLDRVVCDGQDVRTKDVPSCFGPAVRRDESTGPAHDAEVDAAFDAMGEAGDFYQQVLGIDLGAMVGTDPGSPGVLQSWVRWCTTDPADACPMANAFWDGEHMVLGHGFAAADDVVVHELTHGVIDHTSQLMYLHESGAIDESLADVMGEIADQRDARPGEDDSAWLLGEDAPGGAIRSLKDPQRYGQPDRMTSPLFGAGDAFEDNGDVHQNSGVGNKAAYLISQGGDFNGVTVHGIDAGDLTLTKTATLYGAVLTRLPSGAEYDTLASTLVATCQELAAAGKAGFTSADCGSVQDAVTATEMTRRPTDPAAAAAEAPATCPRGYVKETLFHDDDADGTTNDWTVTPKPSDLRTWPMWTQDPATDLPGTPVYAYSGAGSWYGLDPDPDYYQDPPSSELTPTAGLAIPSFGRTYLHFHHAYVLEWYDAADGEPARYPDGATVRMYTPSGTGWARSTTPLTWVNGPDKPITGGWTGFGGDSHGYGSSRVDLTPLAGRTVRPAWRVAGDSSVGYDGWYVDDIDLYTCRPPQPTAARAVTATGTTSGAQLSWAAPVWGGTAGLAGYRVTRSDGLVRTLPAGTLSTTFGSLPAGPRSTVTVVPLGANGTAGPGVTRTLRRTVTTTSLPTQRVRTGDAVRLSALVTRSDGRTPVAGMPLQLQTRPLHGTTWTTVATRRTGQDGRASLRVVVGRTSYLRVLGAGTVGYMGSASKSLKVTAY